jgi:hypothetical protein
MFSFERKSAKLPCESISCAKMCAHISKYITSQLSSLNRCWNSVYRKIFGFNQWESVKTFIFGMGRTDLHHIISKESAKFYKRLVSATSPAIQALFRSYCACVIIRMIYVYRSLSYVFIKYVSLLLVNFCLV